MSKEAFVKTTERTENREQRTDKLNLSFFIKTTLTQQKMEVTTRSRTANKQHTVSDTEGVSVVDTANKQDTVSDMEGVSAVDTFSSSID